MRSHRGPGQAPWSERVCTFDLHGGAGGSRALVNEVVTTACSIEGLYRTRWHWLSRPLDWHRRREGCPWPQHRRPPFCSPPRAGLGISSSAVPLVEGIIKTAAVSQGGRRMSPRRLAPRGSFSSEDMSGTGRLLVATQDHSLPRSPGRRAVSFLIKSCDPRGSAAWACHSVGRAGPSHCGRERKLM